MSTSGQTAELGVTGKFFGGTHSSGALGSYGSMGFNLNVCWCCTDTWASGCCKSHHGMRTIALGDRESRYWQLANFFMSKNSKYTHLRPWTPKVVSIHCSIVDYISVCTGAIKSPPWVNKVNRLVITVHILTSIILNNAREIRLNPCFVGEPLKHFNDPIILRTLKARASFFANSS